MARSPGQPPQRFALTVEKKVGLARDIRCQITISAAHDSNPENCKQYMALWDTGASETVVSPELVQELALKPIGPGRIYSAGKVSDVNRYLIRLLLPNRVEFPGLPVIDSLLPQPPDQPRFDVLIGMDIITQGDFTISNYLGKTCMSFQVPSMSRTDCVKQINVARNDRRR